MGKDIEIYRPSNGTEGMIFMDEHCDKCFHDRNEDCEIIVASMLYDTNEPEYPKEWRYISNNPTCTKFLRWRDDGNDPDEPIKRKPPDDPNQLCLPFVFNEIMEGKVERIYRHSICNQ
jgi:hypothetical protein